MGVSFLLKRTTKSSIEGFMVPLAISFDLCALTAMNAALNATDISGMSVKHLKQKLTLRRGLPAHGLKPVLVYNLRQPIHNPPLARQLAHASIRTMVWR